MPGSSRAALVFATAAVLVLAVSPASGDVPDPNPALPLYPGAESAGAPPSVKPGLRLTWYQGSASIAGSGRQLVYDPNGKGWIDRSTGQRAPISTVDVPSAGGDGYRVVRVGYVDDEVAVLSTSTYGHDPGTGRMLPKGGFGIVTNAGSAADFWVHPRVLREIEPRDEDGVAVARMTLPLGEKKYDAIRFQVSDRSGYSMTVYDLETGFQLLFASRVEGEEVVTPGPDGRPRPGPGATILTAGYLADATRVDIPWGSSPVPDWVAEFRGLRYRGAHSTAVPGVGSSSRDVVMTVTVKARGERWIRVDTRTEAFVDGVPGGTSAAPGACGPASVGGFWIAPEALAELRPGQEIERNPLTHTRLVVSAVGDGFVTLSEHGDVHRNDATYDTTSGVLRHVNILAPFGLGRSRTTLELSE